MTKTYHLIVANLPLTLTLTPPPSWGYCSGCWQKDKIIWLISQYDRSLKRKFCQPCALKGLTDLANSDYQFQNPNENIEQIRSFLLENYSVIEEKEKIFDCYG